MTIETWKKEIVIGGVSLTLKELDEQFLGEFDSLLKRVFAIEIIKYVFDPSNPSSVDEEYSFVWNGTRLSMSKDTDGKLYLDLAESQNPSISGIPKYEFILQGVPLSTDEDRNLIFYDSGYTVDDIVEYSEMMIGGMPHTVGRVANENKWYWVVRPLISMY